MGKKRGERGERREEEKNTNKSRHKGKQKAYCPQKRLESSRNHFFHSLFLFSSIPCKYEVRRERGRGR